jgi:uncharacterized protein (TIGR00730 family)
MKPTLQIYGTGSFHTQDGTVRSVGNLVDQIEPTFECKMRTDGAFSPVFSFTGEMYAADAMVFFPNCNLFSLCAAIAEKEAHNPFMQHQYDTTLKIPNNKKPIVCLGSEEDWTPFKKIIAGLSKRGTIRGNLLEKTVHFSPNADDMVAFIKANIPSDLSQKRAVQVNHKKYIDEKDAATDYVSADEHTAKPKRSAPTIAFFGSATTVNEADIALAKEAGKACGENGWNIIHGGGVRGVMGALSEGGAAAGVYVHGITADNRYAMLLSGEKDPTKVIPDGAARYTAGKDMIHRIELYARNSEALVALPGGIGTLQEIFLTMMLLQENHPAVLYEDTQGAQVKKPMILVNQDGVWDDVIAYFHDAKRPELTKIFDENISVVADIEEMNAKLKAHFAAHPPKEFAIDRVDDTINTSHRAKVSRKHTQLGLFPAA